MLPLPADYDANVMKEIPLLLHVCCGPCACGCLDPVLETGRRVILYFSNSNLNSQAEYERRLEAAQIAAKHWNAELLADAWDHDGWLESLKSIPDFGACPERGLRCGGCFHWQLARTAEKAAELGCNFTTTLTVSPYKNTAMIHEIGRGWANFEAWDFKKNGGYARSKAISRDLGIYRQDYCGCEFSLRDRLAAEQKE